MALTNYPDKLFPGFDASTYGSIALYNGFWFLLVSTFLLSTGTMILTWLGEQITQHGIGNGISLLITVGILSGLPQSMVLFGKMFTTPLGVEEGVRLGWLQGCLMIALLFVVIAAMVAAQLISAGVNSRGWVHSKPSEPITSPSAPRCPR